MQSSTVRSNKYRLLYSWLYNTEVYLDKCPDDYHIGHADKRVQYGKVIWVRVQNENTTFKLHVVLIVLPCKQQNVTYIRFLKYMHLPLKRTSSYKKMHTQLINIPNDKNFETKRTYDP